MPPTIVPTTTVQSEAELTATPQEPQSTSESCKPPLSFKTRTAIEQDLLQALIPVRSTTAGCTRRQESLDTPTDHHTTAAIILQSSWRKLVARKSYLQIRSATLTLQKTWRGYQARKLSKALAHERDNKAASTIQTHWKMTKERRTYQDLK